MLGTDLAVKFLQLTDIHLTETGKTIAGRDPVANFKKAISHALENHGDAEFIVITGDLSDWGEKQDYELLRSIISDLTMPVHLCIGNHDDRGVFLSVFPEKEGAKGFVQDRFDMSHGTGFILDSWGKNSHAGFYCAQRCAWLDEQLSSLDGEAWLFLHHNPLPTGIAPMDEIMLQGAEAFGAIVKKHASKIRYIVHGHCHLPLAGELHGVPVYAPRGTNHAGWPSFGAKNLLSGSDLPEAYAVFQVSDLGTSICMVEYGYDGEIRSEGSPDYEEWNKLTMIR